MKKRQNIAGLLLLIIILAIGKNKLESPMLFFRLLIGIGFGYTLTRSFLGFAGSVNRAYNTGSTKLMRVLAYIFLGTSILTAGLLLNSDVKSYTLLINPINIGLIAGGLIFGFGMSFSVCCASGVLTDLVTGFSRAVITLIFFGMGVFIGFPLQMGAKWLNNYGISTDWVRKSWFTSETGLTSYGGVYLPDLFKNDGLNGYLGAILMTALLCGILIYISKKYEVKRKLEGTFKGVPSEKEQYNMKIVEEDKEIKLFSKEVYEKLFVTPWTMEKGGVIIAILFTLLMGATKGGWGASTPYGWWFGRLLLGLGVPVETLVNYSSLPKVVYQMPFFSNPMNLQNMGIIVGTIICLLLAGSFTETVTQEIKINFKQVILYAVGGLLMGFGTRLSNGCNVGALYTPIANFSLSGWVFLLALVGGGILGNKVTNKIKI
jgi:uncharacterized membrane protein YedE/YeeE